MKEDYTLIRKTSPAKGEHYLLISGKQRLGKFRSLDLAKEYVMEVFGLEDIEVVDTMEEKSEEMTNDKEQG